MNMKTDPNNCECKICEICEQYAEWEACGTRKVVDFNPETDTARVYHIGNYTCWSKIGTEEAKAFIESRQEKHKVARKAKDVVIETITEKIWSSEIEGAEQDAATGQTLDLHKGSLVNKIHFMVKTTVHLMQCLYWREKLIKKTNSTSIGSTMEPVTTHLTTF